MSPAGYFCYAILLSFCIASEHMDLAAALFHFDLQAKIWIWLSYIWQRLETGMLAEEKTSNIKN